ncbi:hypothetical protein NFIA_050900 [Paecilomyces variotii No. 5]|uniref:Uncharacterized protein n=1 Tax=Byssochlamys spectabilis (strain No. 5 / NBRC 109023) TaxID=1356009 RepID=V5FJJ6_BYSSN|nr:hypothetical protein NFIA_050900 [Paecilomyces variotii No. 5]
MKSRMFSFSRGSSKQQASVPQEDRSRYYDFVDTPVFYRPESPLIERPVFSPELIGKLRCSCMLLFHHIETGQPSRLSYQPETATVNRFYAQRQSTQEAWHQSPNQNDCISPTSQQGEAFRKDKYDSGVELSASSPDLNERRKRIPMMDLSGHRVSRSSAEYQQGGPAAGTSATRLYESESDSESENHSRASSSHGKPNKMGDSSFMSAREQSPEHLSTSGIEHMIDQSLAGLEERQDGTQSRSFAPEVSFDSSLLSTIPPRDAIDTYELQEESELDDSDTDAWIGISGSQLPGRVPSLSRPKSTSRRRKPATDTQPDRESDESNGSEGIAIIINEDGERRIMSAAEERRRKLDLQNAVMEKMCTGVITAEEEKKRQLQLQRAVMEKMTGAIGVITATSISSHQERPADAADYSLWPSSKYEQIESRHYSTRVANQLGAPKSPSFADIIRIHGCLEQRAPNDGTTNGRTKKADKTYRPADLPQGRSTLWPTMIIEVRYSENKVKLAEDARWWLMEAGGDVKTALTISVHQVKTEITVEKWELTPRPTRQDSNKRVVEVTEHIVMSQNEDEPIHVAGHPLMIPFDHFFLRPPNPGEGDIILHKSDIETIAKMIWDVHPKV